MAATRFPGDNGTLAYASDSGVYVPAIEYTVPPGRARFTRAEALQRDSAVFLCFGQSNAGNAGSGRYAPRQPVFCFNPFDSRFYSAEDPVPGATGNGGGPWGRLGDLLVEAGYCRSALFIVIAVGGSYLAEWGPGGPHNRRLALAVERSVRAGIAIGRMLWSQGEAESNLTEMSRDTYKRAFLNMLADVRRMGVSAPVHVARSTLCATAAHPYDNRREIRSAQAELVDPAAGILPGPDTDAIGMEGRADGCHFNESGLQRAAQLWFESVTASMRLPLRRRVRDRLATVFGRAPEAR